MATKDQKAETVQAAKAYTFDPSLLNHGSDGFYCWGLHWDVSTDTLRVGINWHRPADTTNPVDFEIANAIWETEVDAVYSKGTTSYGYVANASIDEYPEDSCICVVRDDENSEFKVLTPCGICQERLRYWGEDVLMGVTTEDNSLKFVRLGELMPYYWGKAYKHGTD